MAERAEPPSLRGLRLRSRERTRPLRRAACDSSLHPPSGKPVLPFASLACAPSPAGIWLASGKAEVGLFAGLQPRRKAFPRLWASVAGRYCCVPSREVLVLDVPAWALGRSKGSPLVRTGMGTPEERDHLSFSLLLVPSVCSPWLGRFLSSLWKLERNRSGSHCYAPRDPVWKENHLEAHPSLAPSPTPSPCLSLSSSMVRRWPAGLGSICF